MHHNNKELFHLFEKSAFRSTEKITDLSEMILTELSNTEGEEDNLKKHVENCGRRFKISALLSLSNSNDIKSLRRMVISIGTILGIAIYTKDLTLPFLLKILGILATAIL